MDSRMTKSLDSLITWEIPSWTGGLEPSFTNPTNPVAKALLEKTFPSFVLEMDSQQLFGVKLNEESFLGLLFTRRNDNEGRSDKWIRKGNGDGTIRSIRAWIASTWCHRKSRCERSGLPLVIVMRWQISKHSSPFLFGLLVVCCLLIGWMDLLCLWKTLTRVIDFGIEIVKNLLLSLIHHFNLLEWIHRGVQFWQAVDQLT